MKQDLVEAIRERLALEEVVGNYLELRRSGRNLKALSPFNHEKTPSFVVSPEKQIWHDFSSGKGGTLFGFVMEMEGVDFKEALTILAQKAGLDISEYRRQGSADQTQRKQAALKALALAAKFYQVQLVNNKQALDYVVKKRGFNKQSIRDFCIGYAPDNWSALADYMRTKGIPDEVTKIAGLTGTNKRGGVYDFFRGRIMVPLMDIQGQTIGFTARQLVDDDQSPKYINTSQTLLYDKSRHVFGYSQAKDEIRKTSYAVVVEGNLDVISSHQVGVKNVVATAGTAATSQHLRVISRTVNDIRLAFDADRAGMAATERIIGLAQNINNTTVGSLKLSVIQLPDNQDPDDIARRDAAEWRQLISESEYALDWLYNKYKQQLDVRSASGKRELTDIILPVIRNLKDDVEKDHYIKLLAEDANISAAAVENKLKTIKPTTTPTKKFNRPTTEALPQPHQDREYLEKRLLGLMIIYSPARHLHKASNTKLKFSSTAAEALHEHIDSSQQADIDEDNLPERLQEYTEYVKLATFIATESYKRLDANEKLREVVALADKIVEIDERDKRNRLTQALKHAQAEGDDQRAVEIMKELDGIK